MDLSRLFANINHDRLISKLNAYDATNATKDSLKFIKKLAKIAGKEHVQNKFQNFGQNCFQEYYRHLLLGHWLLVSANACNDMADVTFNIFDLDLEYESTLKIDWSNHIYTQISIGYPCRDSR